MAARLGRSTGQGQTGAPQLGLLQAHEGTTAGAFEARPHELQVLCIRRPLAIDVRHIEDSVPELLLVEPIHCSDGE